MKSRVINIVIAATMLGLIAAVPWPGDTPADQIKSWRERFDKASREQLGTDADAAIVRGMILRDIEMPHAGIKELRWESPTVVVARAFWAQSTIAAGRLLYALEKRGGEWHIVLHVYTGVS
jgi:hypothetical protein